MKLFGNEKGIALITAVSMIFAGSALVSAVVAFNMQQANLLRHQKFSKRRNRVAQVLSKNSIQPAILYISAVSGRSIAPGNSELYSCLGIDYLDHDSDIDSGVGDCENMQEHEFLLIPSEDFSYHPESCRDDGEVAVGLVEDLPTSCFLAGEIDGKKIGYSFKGATGQWNDQFPLRARVFFRPICKDDRDSCHFAEEIQFRYELIHQKATSRRLSHNITRDLGTFPNKPIWTNINRTKIVGSECNTGAIVFQNDNGRLDCRCQSPYIPDIGEDGLPKQNSHGPVCKLMDQLCPIGFSHVGNDPGGVPICREIVNETYFYPSSGFYTYHSTAGTGNVTCRSDSGVDVGGWVSQLKMSCSTAIEYEERNTAGFNADTLSGGLVMGGVAAGVVALMWGVTAGLMFVGVGVVVLLFLAWDWDWSLWPTDALGAMQCDTTSDGDEVFCPYVDCEYELRCQAFRPPGGTP